MSAATTTLGGPEVLGLETRRGMAVDGPGGVGGLGGEGETRPGGFHDQGVS